MLSFPLFYQLGQVKRNWCDRAWTKSIERHMIRSQKNYKVTLIDDKLRIISDYGLKSHVIRVGFSDVFEFNQVEQGNEVRIYRK